MSRRYYLNQRVAAEDAWVSPTDWDALADSQKHLEPGDPIALFFDGSLSQDATALVGCRIDDGHVFSLGVWEPNPNDPDDRVPIAAVDLAVDRAFEQYQVFGFFADVREWESFAKVTWPERYADRLLVWAQPSAKEPQPIAWDMRGQTHAFTQAVELTEREILDGQFTHDGDDAVARHVANARRRPNRSGVGIGKESKDSPRKVDAAVCVVGARMVRRQVLASKQYANQQRRAMGMVVFR